MENNTAFCTVTMARVYVKQGCLEKAADIYRRLLAREPERRDLLEGLSEVEGKIEAAHKGRQAELARLLHQWVELSLWRGRHAKLMRLQRQRRE